jgi:transcriptional antiterminator
MYREFISPAEEKKLEIFKVVCNSNGVTLVQLSEVLNIPQKSLQKYIYFLNEDLQLLSPHLLLSKNHYNQYFLNRTEDDEPFYAQLMYHYLLNSTQYNLIHYLIGRPQMTLTQLCLDLHVSQSHMYRLIKKINQLLEKFQIQIRTDLNNRIVLAGKELDIRIFTYSFLTQSAPADLWLLPSVSHKNVEEFTAFFAVSHFDPLTKNKLAAFWQAVVSRTIQKKYLPVIPEKYMELMNFYCFLPEEILDSLFLSADYASEKTLQSEYLYLNFFLHVFLPGVIPQEKNQAIIQEIKHSDTDLVRFFTAMIKDWHDTFAPSQEVAEFEKLLSSCLLVFNLSIFWKCGSSNTNC